MRYFAHSLGGLCIILLVSFHLLLLLALMLFHVVRMTVENDSYPLGFTMANGCLCLCNRWLTTSYVQGRKHPQADSTLSDKVFSLRPTRFSSTIRMAYLVLKSLLAFNRLQSHPPKSLRVKRSQKPGLLFHWRVLNEEWRREVTGVNKSRYR
ncbi:hypothetical protein C8R41DRAFT_19075 [Lentinula lateritia]|uniref:Uncharacterized protein n=1 Tax=Lentinula lateritia TaxID=40482 RepID=A0ABQ8VZP2_9AGAR|nr:hypothetical protein C8R41DRAFT_19075 [Lentinula lateritia]